jgi:YHS domain-containing protein
MRAGYAEVACRRWRAKEPVAREVHPVAVGRLGWMDTHTPPSTPDHDVAIDPVCGMEVRIEGAQHTAEYEGRTWYFCGKGCRLEFEDGPARFFDPDYVPSM